MYRLLAENRTREGRVSIGPSQALARQRHVTYIRQNLPKLTRRWGCVTNTKQSSLVHTCLHEGDFWTRVNSPNNSDALTR